MLNQNPLFVNSSNYDFSYEENSPCIDSGNPNYLDPDGTTSDIGANYFSQSNLNDCLINYDANNDSELNILDIIDVINLILYGIQLNCNIDYDGDNEINVLDVVIIVNLILQD